jgi:peptidoglycan/LPS O-acetylase OafA/YrhL
LRLSNLDELRGAAALAVTLFHCCFAANFLPDNTILSEIAQFGDKGVQVFFILSGLVIPWSLSLRKYNFNLVKEFLLRRFIRIQTPYAIALIFTILSYLYFINPSLRFDLISILANFIYLVPYTEDSWILNVAWTLGVEVQFYLLITIFLPFFTSKKANIRRITLICLISVGLIPPPNLVNPWYFFPTWAPFFGVGILLFLFHSSKISTFEYYLSFAVILCFISFKYTYLLTLVCLFTTIFLLFCNSIKLPSTLAYVGKISYSLYLIHLPIILIVGRTLFDYNLSQKFPNLSIAILVLSAVCCSILFYFLFEKPSLSWAKKLKKA